MPEFYRWVSRFCFVASMAWMVTHWYWVDYLQDPGAQHVFFSAYRSFGWLAGPLALVVLAVHVLSESSHEVVQRSTPFSIAMVFAPVVVLSDLSGLLQSVITGAVLGPTGFYLILPWLTGELDAPDERTDHTFEPVAHDQVTALIVETLRNGPTPKVTLLDRAAQEGITEFELYDAMARLDIEYLMDEDSYVFAAPGSSGQVDINPVFPATGISALDQR